MIEVWSACKRIYVHMYGVGEYTSRVGVYMWSWSIYIRDRYTYMRRVSPGSKKERKQGRSNLHLQYFNSVRGPVLIPLVQS